MASVKLFLFRYKKLKDGSHPIVIQVIKDGSRKLINLGFSARPNQWDDENNVPNSKHPDYKSLILHIKEKRSQAVQALVDLEHEKRPYTIEELVEKIKGSDQYYSFYEFTENLISKLTRTGNLGNARVYENTFNVFKKFMDDKDIDFKALNYKKIKEFEEYLYSKDRKVNTVSVHLRTLRAIYNRAIKEKIVRKELYPFDDIKISKEETQKLAITREDIDKIRDLDLSDNIELEKARDYFMFSFYMRGMSFIDLAYLKGKNINNGRINYTRKKTRQKFSIKLTENAKQIIGKYSDLSDPDSFIFPIIQRKGDEYLDYRNAMRLSNKKLKTIGEMVGLSTQLSTYVSRHSWATIAKRSGISTAIISEGLGHDTEQTTQIYLDSFGSDVLDDANEKITG